MRTVLTIPITNPSGGVVRVDFSNRDWAHLNVLRKAAHSQERKHRVKALRTSTAAQLGTDHPALLVREITHDYAQARLQQADTAEQIFQDLPTTEPLRRALDAAMQAELTLDQAKALALRYVAASEAAKRVLHRVASLKPTQRTVLTALTDQRADSAEVTQAPPDRQLFTHTEAAPLASADAGEAPPAAQAQTFATNKTVTTKTGARGVN